MGTIWEQTSSYAITISLQISRLNSNAQFLAPEQLVFNRIKATPGVSANALIQQTDNIVRTIRRVVVKQLIDSGLVEYRGSKKTGGYFVLPDK
jgi:ATP-dependent DNA helicase RecG